MNQTILQKLTLKDATNAGTNQSKFALQGSASSSAHKTANGKLVASKVDGLNEYAVFSELDCLNLLRIGEKNKLMRLKQLANLENDSKRSSSLF